MALTKYQKLARGLKALLHHLNDHYQKTAAVLNAVQFHFFEPHALKRSPEITKPALSLMTRVYICGIQRFSSNAELRSNIQSLPFFSFILPHPTPFLSRVRFSPSDAPKNAKLIIPWDVRIVLPTKTLQQLEEAKLEALLYCASVEEMSEWIDWFEREDEANTLVHQLLAVGDYYRERAPFEAKLNQLAFPFYRDAALEHYKKIEFPKVFKTLKTIDFAPNETSSIAESYTLVTNSLKARNKRHFEDFQKTWRNLLKKLMFADLNWTFDQKESALAEYFPPKEPRKRKIKNLRWNSSLVVDRRTYASFIQYFAKRFLKDPSRNKMDGEITLLLWIMIYVSREPHKICPVRQLLQLTTTDVDDRILCLKHEEIELSCGLADLIQEFIGIRPCKQPKRLLPHLTVDKLEDHFHRASKALLPPESSPALPEAFLTFPHGFKNLRMVAQLQRMRQQQSFPHYDNPISWKNIKNQLFKNASQQH